MVISVIYVNVTNLCSFIQKGFNRNIFEYLYKWTYIWKVDKYLVLSSSYYLLCKSWCSELDVFQGLYWWCCQFNIDLNVFIFLPSCQSSVRNLRLTGWLGCVVDLCRTAELITATLALIPFWLTLCLCLYMITTSLQHHSQSSVTTQLYVNTDQKKKINILIACIV